MKVLSLFDGISCGLQVLKELGVNVESYSASEIDKNAIEISQKNHPEIIRLEDVRDLSLKDSFDLLMGGSPCQSLSFAGKGQGLESCTLSEYLRLKEEGFKFEGQSFLFWEYIRILKEVKPKYFLLENVVCKKEFIDIISNELGVEPILIDSQRFGAQKRKRLYWTNLKVEPIPTSNQQMVKDILAPEFGEKWIENGVFYPCQVTKGTGLGGLLTGNSTLWGDDYSKISHFRGQCRVYSLEGKSPTLICSETSIFKFGDKFRRLNSVEKERLQGLPDNYTLGVAEGARTKAIGNCWTVPVIKHILQRLK